MMLRPLIRARTALIHHPSLLINMRTFSKDMLPTLILFTKKYVCLYPALTVCTDVCVYMCMFTLQSPCSLCDDAVEVLKQYEDEVCM